jgi:hypothetical protein
MLSFVSFNSPSVILSAAASSLQTSINSLTIFDVGRFFAQFSLPTPSITVASSGGLVGFQFGTSDALVDVGQEWDVAIDDAALKTIITNRFDPLFAAIRRAFRDPRFNIESRASGHFLATITATGDAGIFGIPLRDQEVFIYLDVGFDLNSVWRNKRKEGDLIMKVDWSSYAGTGSSTQIFEDYIRPIIVNLGVTVVSSHTFLFTDPLPEMGLGDTHFLYANLNATQPQGGIRLIGTAPNFILQNNGIINVDVQPFPDKYHAINDCGRGSRPPQAIANAGISNEGTLCSIEFIDRLRLVA